MSEIVQSKHERVLIQGEELAAILYQPKSVKAEVVLVHGFTGSKEDFILIAEFLAANGFKVLTFDNRGQHESAYSKRSDGYSMASLGRDVVEISRHYGLKKPHLLGHSFGGLIAQQAVVLHPETWSSLTLMCSGPGGRDSWLNEPQFKILSNETKEEIWERVLAPDRLEHPRFELLRKRWISSDAESTLIYRDHLIKQKSLIPQIASIGIAAHVIYGENDDAWPLEDQNQMARDLKATLTVLPQCGHCPNEDNPPLTAKALAHFWEMNAD